MSNPTSLLENPQPNADTSTATLPNATPATEHSTGPRSNPILRTDDAPLAAAAPPVASVPFCIRAEGNLSPRYQRLKRAMDVVGALVLIVMLSPILIATFAVLFITTRGRPVFSQVRVGLQGRTFRMYKFRTMRLDADRLQHLVSNEQDGPVFKNRRDPRITRIGRILRSTSIDEMPQLFNVLLGHMALVGPRPPVPKEVVLYQPWQRRRLSIKPGLTCIWQVSGRCEIGFEEWVRMDIRYAKQQNALTDLRLLAKTPLAVLSRRGAY